MKSDSTRSREGDAGGIRPVSGGQRVAGDTVTYDTPVVARTGAMPVSAGTRVGEDVMTVKDRVRWGPILAGLLTTIASMLVLTILGLALGTSAFKPGDTHGLGTAAGIWGAISAIISFFLGGWVAAKTASVGGSGSGLLNGFMVGATALALILWLTGSGLGNLLGTVGNNIGEIANVAQDQAQSQGVTTTDQQQNQAQDAAQNATNAVKSAAQDNYDSAKNGAWGTLVGLLLALGSSAAGGLAGYNTRRELIQGTG